MRTASNSPLTQKYGDKTTHVSIPVLFGLKLIGSPVLTQICTGLKKMLFSIPIDKNRVPRGPPWTAGPHSIAWVAWCLNTLLLLNAPHQTRVLHHSSLGLHCRGCSYQISWINFPKYNTVMVGNWCNLNRSGWSNNILFPTPFSTAYQHFILIEHRYSLHSALRTSALFYLWGLCTACATMLRAG